MASTTKAKKTTKATTATKLPPNPFVFEILNEVSKQRTIAKKVELLQQYRTDALVSILIWNFDDSIISMRGYGRSLRESDARHVPGVCWRPFPGSRQGCGHRPSAGDGNRRNDHGLMCPVSQTR